MKNTKNAVFNGIEALSIVQPKQIIKVSEKSADQSIKGVFVRTDEGLFISPKTNEVLPIDNTFLSTLFEIVEAENGVVSFINGIPVQEVSMVEALDLFISKKDAWVTFTQTCSDPKCGGHEEETQHFAEFSLRHKIIETINENDSMPSLLKSMVLNEVESKGNDYGSLPFSAILNGKFYKKA